jgi:hypothetical protein
MEQMEGSAKRTQILRHGIACIFLFSTAFFASSLWIGLMLYRIELMTLLGLGPILLLFAPFAYSWLFPKRKRVILAYIASHCLVIFLSLVLIARYSDEVNTLDLCWRSNGWPSELQAEVQRVIEANPLPRTKDLDEDLNVRAWKNLDGTPYQGLFADLAEHARLVYAPVYANEPYVQIGFGGGFVEPRGLIIGQPSMTATESMLSRYDRIVKIRPGCYAFDMNRRKYPPEYQSH